MKSLQFTCALFAACLLTYTIPVKAQDNGEDKIFKKDCIIKQQKDSLAECTVTIDWPDAGTHKKLKNGITSYFNEQFGYPADKEWPDKYEMAANCSQNRFKGLRKEAQNNLDAGIPIHAPYFNNTEIKCIYDNKNVVTYTSTTFLYAGGAHPITSFVPATFLKKNGEKIGYGIFKNTNSKEFKQAIVSGLKKYFNVKTDKELKSCLLDVENLNEIPLPKSAPYITEDGICLIYGQYEIAPYVYGMPKITFAGETAKVLIKDGYLLNR